MASRAVPVERLRINGNDHRGASGKPEASRVSKPPLYHDSLLELVLVGRLPSSDPSPLQLAPALARSRRLQGAFTRPPERLDP